MPCQLSSLFAQLFTILGVRRRKAVNGEDVAVPLVYAYLTGKSEDQYRTVMTAVRDADAVQECRRFGQCVLDRVLMDFEFAIKEATKDVFPHIEQRCCFYHLGQSVYRQIQCKGLQ